MDIEQIADALNDHEVEQRVARGMPKAHCMDLAQFPFAYSDAQLDFFFNTALGEAERQPGNDTAQLWAGLAHMARKDYDAANRYFAAAVKINPKSKTSVLRLGIIEPATVPLPDVVGEWPRDSCLFVGCDHSYAQGFLLPLLKSLLVRSPDQRVHVHLFGPHVDPAGLIRDLPKLPITVTQEDPQAFLLKYNLPGQTYYGAVRIVRFAQALAQNAGPLWMCDVDALFNRSPAALFASPEDMAMRVRYGRVEPWNQFSACLLMGRPQARDYYNRVATFVTRHLLQPLWGLDQLALFSAWISLETKPQLRLLGPVETDVGDFIDEAIMWFTAGKKKHRLFEKPRPADPTKFETAFWQCQAAPAA